MSPHGDFTEQQLADIERRRDPGTISLLVSAIRQQQHDLDNLRLSLDVARRDREELRVALLRAQDELRRLRAGDGG